MDYQKLNKVEQSIKLEQLQIEKQNDKDMLEQIIEREKYLNQLEYARKMQ